MKIKPIEKSLTSTKVFDALYEMIETGVFERGQRLPPQDKLANQLGVSRNTLREAIKQLSAIGLLRSRQGVGTVVEVSDGSGYLNLMKGQFLLDSISVREFIEARICIERTVIRLAVERAKEEDVQNLRVILKEQRTAISKDDLVEFTRQDASFHFAIAEIGGNRVLLKFLQTIQGMLHRFIGEVSRLSGAVEEALRFHSQITDAIAAKNKDLAEEVVVLHLFDVIHRIEINLGMDLKKESLCGINLIHAAEMKLDGVNEL
jgi:GntR family transcriptional regulator, transcriptional repressor for pyruvate dehydrogenase complex